MKKVGFLAISLTLLSLLFQLFYPISHKEPVLFEVQKGQTFQTILASLHQNNLIRGEFSSKLYAKLFGYNRGMKVGRYRIDQKRSSVSILKFLAKPENGEISITIPEGFSIFDIDKKLSDLEVMQPNEFSRAAIGKEGYLFPDTYYIYAKNFNPTDLIVAMETNFQKKVAEGLSDDLKKSKRSLAELVTMASLLEKEVKFEKDLPVVAGILWKRLDRGWSLQADATLLYGKTVRSISSGYLKEDSPYNTYTRKGLPPTPIGNPGLKTIQAAIFPEDSQYWFYITDKEGHAKYARTNEEQNRNREKYL